jgi:hypothetical protein
MWMTNKTQSQRIGTALPSDLRFKHSIDSTIGGIRRPSSLQTDPPVCGGSRVCAHCGAKIGAGHQRPLRTAELILNGFCCMLLIAVALCVVHFLNSWAERGFDSLFDHWVWHEPLNYWNQ